MTWRQRGPLAPPQPPRNWGDWVAEWQAPTAFDGAHFAAVLRSPSQLISSQHFYVNAYAGGAHSLSNSRARAMHYAARQNRRTETVRLLPPIQEETLHEEPHRLCVPLRLAH